MAGISFMKRRRTSTLFAVSVGLCLLWGLPAWLIVHCTANAARVIAIERASKPPTMGMWRWTSTPGSGSFFGFPESDASVNRLRFGIPGPEEALYRIRQVGPIYFPSWMTTWDKRVLRRWVFWSLAAAGLVNGGAWLGAGLQRRSYRGFAQIHWQGPERASRRRSVVLAVAFMPLLGIVSWWMDAERGFALMDAFTTGYWFDPTQAGPGGNKVANAVGQALNFVFGRQEPQDGFVPGAGAMWVCLMFASAATFVMTQRSLRRLSCTLERQSDAAARICPACAYPAGKGVVCTECGRPWSPDAPRWLGRRWLAATRLTCLIAVGAAACVYSYQYPFDPALVPSGLWRWATLQQNAPWMYEELCREADVSTLEIAPESGISLSAKEGRLDIVRADTPELWQGPIEKYSGRVAVFAWQWTPSARSEASSLVHLSISNHVKYVPIGGGKSFVKEYPVVMGGPGLYVEQDSGGSFVVRGTVLKRRQVPLIEASGSWGQLSESAKAKLHMIMQEVR